MFLKKSILAALFNSFSMLENQSDWNLLFFFVWMTALSLFFVYQLKFANREKTS
jgi:hypothetical protein